MRTFIMIISALMLLGCSKKEPYEKAINEYYRSHLHNPSSYKLVRMGTPKAITRISVIFKYGHEKGFASSEVEKQAKEYAAELQEKGISPSETIAYEVQHRYRAKNAMNALVLENEIVVLDTTMTQVIKVLKYE